MKVDFFPEIRMMLPTRKHIANVKINLLKEMKNFTQKEYCVIEFECRYCVL